MKILINSLLFLTLMITLNGCATSQPFHVPTKDARASYINSHKIEDPAIRSAIKSGKVIKGMTKEQVEAAWGEPSYNFGNRWEFKGWDNQIVTFENGIVTNVKKFSTL